MAILPEIQEDIKVLGFLGIHSIEGLLVDDGNNFSEKTIRQIKRGIEFHGYPFLKDGIDIEGWTGIVIRIVVHEIRLAINGKVFVEHIERIVFEVFRYLEVVGGVEGVLRHEADTFDGVALFVVVVGVVFLCVPVAIGFGERLVDGR